MINPLFDVEVRTVAIQNVENEKKYYFENILDYIIT